MRSYGTPLTAPDFSQSVICSSAGSSQRATMIRVISESPGSVTNQNCRWSVVGIHTFIYSWLKMVMNLKSIIKFQTSHQMLKMTPILSQHQLTSILHTLYSSSAMVLGNLRKEGTYSRLDIVTTAPCLPHSSPLAHPIKTVVMQDLVSSQRLTCRNQSIRQANQRLYSSPVMWPGRHTKSAFATPMNNEHLI